MEAFGEERGSWDGFWGRVDSKPGILLIGRECLVLASKGADVVLSVAMWSWIEGKRGVSDAA